MGHWDYGLALGTAYQQALAALPLSEASWKALVECSAHSLQEMEKIESASDQDFEAYLRHYFRGS